MCRNCKVDFRLSSAMDRIADELSQHANARKCDFKSSSHNLLWRIVRFYDRAGLAATAFLAIR